MREQVRTRAVGSLAGQMFVVHEVMGIENPVTRDRFSWMLLFVPFACDWTSSSQICSCSHVIIERHLIDVTFVFMVYYHAM